MMADIRAQITRAKEAANDIAESASGKFRDTTGRARESASDLIQSGRHRAGDAYSDARDRSQRVAARANEIVQEHPVAVVAGAVAAGALVAWMFPKSRAAMKALPGLATTAGAKVLEAALAARTAAAESAETLKSTAGDVLHSASESAKDAAATAQQAAASADLGGKASRLADDVATLIAGKVDALSEAVKARLPKT
jgi:ElaB/YqjD/DUF883 family membrane-anchored ribosome-binding protein